MTTTSLFKYCDGYVHIDVLEKKKGQDMSKIIILKSVKDIAMNAYLKNVILFGETDLIDDGNNIYDLIFHAKETHPYEIKKVTSLVVPVIRVKDKDDAINKIDYLYLKYPAFPKYAVVEQGQDFLDFYEVCPKKLGKEIKHLGKYNVVDEMLLYGHAMNDKFESLIEDKKKTIDVQYKNSTEQFGS